MDKVQLSSEDCLKTVRLPKTCLFLVFVFLLFSPAIFAAEKVFLLDSTNQLENIPRKHLSFLEGYDEHAIFEQIQQADWQPELSSHQSLVDGYWVKFSVKNNLDSPEIGLVHNLNFEKKIFVKKSFAVKEYPYWKFRKDHYVSEDHVGTLYRLMMPQKEITVVYNFFKSKPFNRFYSAKNGLNRMMLGDIGKIFRISM